MCQKVWKICPPLENCDWDKHLKQPNSDISFAQPNLNFRFDELQLLHAESDTAPKHKIWKLKNTYEHIWTHLKPIGKPLTEN